MLFARPVRVSSRPLLPITACTCVPPGMFRVMRSPWTRFKLLKFSSEVVVPLSMVGVMAAIEVPSVKPVILMTPLAAVAELNRLLCEAMSVAIELSSVSRPLAPRMPCT